MSTPSIQTLITQAQQVLNLKSSNEIRATLAAILANANVGTPLNPNLTTQQLWDEFYEIVRQPSDDIMSIITDQMMRMVFTPPAPGGAGADKQVIFNDAGVLAGDAGLVYNKTTDALTVAGLVTAGSATITGDLTVDTSTLKVDSTNNRVGIGLVTPNRNLSIFGASNSLIHFTTTATGPLNTDGFTFGVETDSSVTLFNAENTPFNFYVNSTLGMTLNSTGNVSIANGNLVMSTSGKGIDFSAVTGGTGTVTANVLNDYEEGTFTPTVGGTATYTTQSGRYTKIGNRVYVNMRLEILLIGTGSSFLISGLPFTSGATSNISSASVGYFGSLAISANYIAGYIASGGSTVRMTGTTAASANITNGIAVIGNATDIALSFFYEV